VFSDTFNEQIDRAIVESSADFDLGDQWRVCSGLNFL